MTWPDGLWQWSFDPTVMVGVLLAAVVYWRGRRPLEMVRSTRNAPMRWWNALAFYLGLLVIVVALESPIDTLSASLFTFHMMQHLLLIMVAAPLLLLGDPAITLLRGVPLRTRRAVLRHVAARVSIHEIGRWVGWTRSPVVAFGLFIGDLYLWHWHVLFNLTLQNDTVHVLEHICFLATSILLWSQIIDQRALHARMSYIKRAAYVVFTAAAGNALAMYFVFAPRPLYTAYAHLTHRPFAMTAIGDQQIAGALMWVPVLFIFGGAAAICFYKALGEEERRAQSALPLPGASYSVYGPEVL
jgi:putative membrane protein